MSDKAVRVFSAFRQVFVAAKDLPSNAEINVPIPRFDYTTLYQLVEISASLLVKQKTVVAVDPPVYVISDISGNVVDLIRILTKTESFTNNRFIFLGNYFDNYTISEDVLALVTSLIILFPNNIYLLRSNMDVSLDNTNNMDITLFNSVRTMMSLCPIAAVIKNFFFCSADGIWIDQPLISRMMETERPSTSIYPTFPYNVDFDRVKAFFEKNNIRRVLRGGEPVLKGIEKTTDGRVINIFSNTNYHNKRNRGGFVFISADFETKGYNIPLPKHSHKPKPQPAADTESGPVVRDKKMVFKMNFSSSINQKTNQGMGRGTPSALKPRKLGSMTFLSDKTRRRTIQGAQRPLFDGISNINPGDQV